MLAASGPEPEHHKVHRAHVLKTEFPELSSQSRADGEERMVGLGVCLNQWVLLRARRVRGVPVRSRM